MATEPPRSRARRQPFRRVLDVLACFDGRSLTSSFSPVFFWGGGVASAELLPRSPLKLHQRVQHMVARFF
jgi:hypothetical protein